MTGRKLGPEEFIAANGDPLTGNEKMRSASEDDTGQWLAQDGDPRLAAVRKIADSSAETCRWAWHLIHVAKNAGTDGDGVAGVRSEGLARFAGFLDKELATLTALRADLDMASGCEKSATC